MTNDTGIRRLFREHLIAALIILASLLICFHKLVWHPTAVLVGPQSGGENDLVNYYIPSRTFHRQGLLEAGRLVDWNSRLSMGTAYLGNPQSAVFYPPNWLTIAFDPSWSLSWLQLLHHWWMGMGVMLLCRQLQVSFRSSVFGGIVMACAPFLVAQGAEGHYAQIAAAAWFPWAFLAFQRFVSSPTMRQQTLVAVCLAMSFLCNHPQETYYLVLALSIVLCWHVLQALANQNREHSIVLLKGWISVGLMTIGLVAIDLIPIYFHSRTTPRGHSAISPELMGWAAYDLRHLWQLVDPFAIDRPESWQRGTPPFWEKLGYFGILPICLAITAALTRFRDATIRQYAAIGLLTILVAMGTNGILFPLMLKVVPGTSWFRLPSRILFLTSMCVAVLAACGLDTVKRTEARPRIVFFTLLWASVIAIAVRFFAIQKDGVWNTIFHTSLVVYPVLAAAAVGLLIGIRTRLTEALAIVLAFMAFVELISFADQVTAVARVHSIAERQPELAGTLRQLEQEDRLGRLLTVQELLSDQDAIANNIDKVRGYDPAASIFYLTLASSLTLSDATPLDPTGFTQPPLESLDVVALQRSGVTHILRVRRPMDQTLPADWTRLWTGELEKRVQRHGYDDQRTWRAELLEVPAPLPYASVVGEAVIAADPDEEQELLATLNFQQSVLVSQDVLPPGPRATTADVSLLTHAQDRLELDVSLNDPGYLVVNELWFPGWKAKVNGQPAPVLRANRSFRAVPLPAGEHRVIMTFHPVGLETGMIITILTVCLLIILFIKPLPRAN